MRVRATRERLHRDLQFLGAGLLDEVVLVVAIGHDLHLGVLASASLSSATKMVPCEPWNTSGAPTPLVTEHASCIVQSV